MVDGLVEAGERVVCQIDEVAFGTGDDLVPAWSELPAVLQTSSTVTCVIHWLYTLFKDLRLTLYFIL